MLAGRRPARTVRGSLLPRYSHGPRDRRSLATYFVRARSSDRPLSVPPTIASEEADTGGTERGGWLREDGRRKDRNERSE